MRLIRVSFLATSAVACVLASAATSASAAPRCGGRVAAALEQRLPVQAYVFGGHHLGETMCSDFTGDGRKDIVFSGWEAMNHGAHFWAAYRATNSGWVRAIFKRSCCRSNPRFGLGIALHHSGSTIVIRQSNYRPSDAFCCPTGGVNEGRWRWVAGRLALVRVTQFPDDMRPFD